METETLNSPFSWVVARFVSVCPEANIPQTSIISQIMLLVKFVAFANSLTTRRKWLIMELEKNEVLRA